MITLGLASVTFRALPVPKVAALVADAGLTAVEWGGDVHAPPGRPGVARAVAAATAAHGLRVASYGSYYRAGAECPAPFEAVLESATAIGAARIRVWAGEAGSAECSAGERGRVVDDLRAIGERARARGLGVSLEFHPRTLADTVESTLELLDAVPGVSTYWQPGAGTAPEDAVREISALASRLTAVHAYALGADGANRPLEESADLWVPVVAEIAVRELDVDVLIEFVGGDDPTAFRRDAQTLRRWVSAAA